MINKLDKDNKLRQDLEDFYAAVLFPIMTREDVRKLIQSVEEEIRKDRYEILPKIFGNFLIERYTMGDQFAQKIVHLAKNEGATDEDIRKYWNLTELDRRLMMQVDNIFRTASYYKAIDEGLSPEEAASRVRKAFPIYGNPEDASKFSGDDRFLPFELRDRVNKYREDHNLSEIEKEVNKYSSFNALIRDEIRKGNL